MIWAIVIGGLGWSLFLYVWLSRLPDMPDLFAPVSEEERRAREELKDAKSKIEDLQIRLKHAEREKLDGIAQVKTELWTRVEAIREARRVLERCPEIVERAG